VFTSNQNTQQDNCNISPWLHYWSDVNTITWPQRKARIETLGDGPADTLKKILLCQGKGTPYQNRLRAQGWAESLKSHITSEMQHFLTIAIYQPSQELLELESALVTLSKINANQAGRIEEQQILQEQQKNQIEQLLNIEAAIMDNSKGDTQ
jgi:hypothetical protein